MAVLSIPLNTPVSQGAPAIARETRNYEITDIQIRGKYLLIEYHRPQESAS